MPQSDVNNVIKPAGENGIQTDIFHYENWIDFQINRVDNSAYSEETLCKYRNLCSNSCRWIADSKYYSCAFVKSAINAGFIKESENDYVDLSVCSSSEFIEFQSGYTKDGYFELCKKCGGYLGINKNRINVAEQER